MESIYLSLTDLLYGGGELQTQLDDSAFGGGEVIGARQRRPEQTDNIFDFTVTGD